MLAWILIIALLVFLIKKYYRILYLSTKFPGPPALPIIGNGLLFLNKKSSENYETLKKLKTDFGEVLRAWIGPQLFIILTEVNTIEELLSNPKFITKSCDYKYLKPWLSDGLLISSGKKWHQRRKILTPAFHFQILEPFINVFDSESDKFMKILSKYQPNESIELFPLVTLYALDVICESAMGTSINAQYNSDSAYVQAVKKISHIVHERQFSFIQRTDFLYRFTPTYYREQRVLKVLHNFTDRVIKERRVKLMAEMNEMGNGNNNDKEPSSDDIGIKKKKTFLDILLESKIDGNSLSDLDIREEVDTFMFEGHDTSTSGISFSLYCIAKYPEVQAKCIKEIYEVIGNDKTKPVTYAELSQLHYLEKVIKETLRIFPSVPIIGRQLDNEITINGKTFPVDASIIIPIYIVGQNEKYFPNPKEFRPERFDIDAQENDRQNYNPFAYIPFSAGPRNCIGQKFAILSMKSVISKVLRHFHMELDSESVRFPTLNVELVLKSDKPIKFKLKPRNV